MSASPQGVVERPDSSDRRVRRRRARPAGGPTFWGRDAIVLLAVLALAPLALGEFGVQTLAAYLPLAMLALSLDWVWGYGGVLSLGQGAFFGIGAYSIAIALEHVSGSPGVAAGLALALLLPALLALALARLLFTRRAQSIFFVAVVTLALAGVIQQVVFKLPDLTGGHNGLIITSTFMPIDLTSAYYVMLAVFGAALLVLTLLARGDFGRRLVGVRENEERLAFLGTPTVRIQGWAFAISGAVAGLGGAMYASYTQIASPDLLTFAFSAQILIWVALGGRGTLIGPAIGTIALSMVASELAESFLFWWQVILGGIFVAVVRFAPEGLYPMVQRLLPRIRERGLELSARAPASPRAAASATEGEPALEVRDVRRSYGSLNVLQGVDLAVGDGELRCLIGPNGAGKSTFIDVVSGRQLPSGGTARIHGTPVLGRPPDEVAARGLQRTFQAATVFDQLSVGENVFLAARADRLGPLLRRTTRVELPEPSLRLLEGGGLDGDLDRPASELSHGARKWLELAMVMARDPSVVLLDEPTAGLTRGERVAVGRLLEAEAERGLAAIVVEHDFDFVRSIAHRVTVLHNGKILAEGTVDELSASDAVRQVYLGSGGA